MGWRGKQLGVWPRYKEGYQEVDGGSVAEYLSGASLEGGTDQKDKNQWAGTVGYRGERYLGFGAKGRDWERGWKWDC